MVMYQSAETVNYDRLIVTIIPCPTPVVPIETVPSQLAWDAKLKGLWTSNFHEDSTHRPL